ncbi:MAG TPA: phosphoribosylanthranilate isomerase, partial [Geminicoccaceae bacterium]|nr:phosphoribosylanthranilate isomerase [Geminicoccaceae bacterium]
AVKVCGLSDPAAVEAAVRGGARYLGFVFSPPSPRSLTPERAAELAAAAPAGVTTVGVLVDPDDAFLDELLACVRLGLLQLHGRETPARVAEVRARTGRPVMKALRIADAADLAPVRVYAEVADLLMFDAKAPARPGMLPGGNGLSFDWRLLRGLDSGGRPWLLSGGLDAANLADAVAASGATAVDVSSGVESRPGVKDPGRVTAFLRAAAALDSDTFAA